MVAFRRGRIDPVAGGGILDRRGVVLALSDFRYKETGDDDVGRTFL